MKLQVLFSVLFALAAVGAPVQAPPRALARPAKRDFNLKTHAAGDNKARRDVGFEDLDWSSLGANVGHDAPGQANAGPEWPHGKRVVPTVPVKSLKRDQLAPAQAAAGGVEQRKSKFRRSHHHRYPTYDTDWSTDTEDEFYRTQPMPPNAGAPATGVSNGIPPRPPRRRAPQAGPYRGGYFNGYDSDSDFWTDSENELLYPVGRPGTVPAAAPGAVANGGRPRHRRRAVVPAESPNGGVPGHVAGNNAGFPDHDHPAGAPVPPGLPTPAPIPMTGARNPGRRQRIPPNSQQGAPTGPPAPNSYDSDGHLRYNSSEDESRFAPSAAGAGGRPLRRRQRASPSTQQGTGTGFHAPNSYDSDGRPRYDSSEDESRFPPTASAGRRPPHRRQRMPQQSGGTGRPHPNDYDSDGNPRYNSSADEARVAPSVPGGGRRPPHRRQRAAPFTQQAGAGNGSLVQQPGVTNGSAFRQPNSYDSDGNLRYNSSEDESRFAPAASGGRRPPRARRQQRVAPTTQQGNGSNPVFHAPNSYDSDGNLRYNSSEDESRFAPAAGGPRPPRRRQRVPHLAYDSDGPYYTTTDDEYGMRVPPPRVGPAAGPLPPAAGGAPPGAQSGGILSGLLSGIGLAAAKDTQGDGTSGNATVNAGSNGNATTKTDKAASMAASKRQLDPDFGLNGEDELPWCC